MIRNNVIFIIVVMVSSLGQVMTDIYLPSLPAIAEGLHASSHAAQLSLSIYMFGFAASILFYGPLSDGIGRRKPLLVGIPLCLSGSILCFSAQSITVMILGRLIQGLGAGVTLSITQPILRDLFDGKTLAKYLSYSAIISVGILALAPLVGGYLQHYFGWRASFLFLIIYTLMAIVAVFFQVPETNQYQHKLNLTLPVIKKNIVTILTNPIFIGYCTCSLLAYGALLAWLTSGPIILQTIVGVTPVAYGWIYVLTGAGFALGAYINALFVPRVGINNMLFIGLLITSFSGLSMTILALLGHVSVLGIVPSAVLLLLGLSMLFPNTSAGVFQHFPTIAGLTSAIFYSSRLLSGAIFSGLIAILPDHTQLPMGIVIFCCAALATIIYKLTQQF